METSDKGAQEVSLRGAAPPSNIHEKANISSERR